MPKLLRDADGQTLVDAHGNPRTLATMTDDYAATLAGQYVGVDPMFGAIEDGVVTLAALRESITLRGRLSLALARLGNHDGNGLPSYAHVGPDLRDFWHWLDVAAGLDS